MRKLACPLLVVYLSGFAFAQCRTCYQDFNVTRGYYGSSLCIRAQECGGHLSLPMSAFLESESPGILLEQRNGKLLVRKVIYDSPAQHAGVQVGDEILSINGRRIGTYACVAGWSGIDHSTAIVFRRGAEVINAQVPAVPLISMLRSQNIVLSSEKGHPSFQLDAPFTFGLRWEEHSGYLEISHVLAGSPAEGAGLRVGDRIVSLNGVSLAATNAADVSQLRDGDLPKRVDIEMADGAAKRRLTLRSRGISEILASPDQRKLIPRTERASLNAIPVPSVLK